MVIVLTYEMKDDRFGTVSANLFFYIQIYSKRYLLRYFHKIILGYNVIYINANPYQDMFHPQTFAISFVRCTPKTFNGDFKLLTKYRYRVSIDTVSIPSTHQLKHKKSKFSCQEL